MRQLVYAILCVMALLAVWYGGWRWVVAEDVARVKASIAYHNRQLKAVNHNIVFKADDVYPIGFPLHFRVRVVRPTLSMVSGRETFAVSFPKILLVPEDRAEGKYQLLVWHAFDALYATDGQAPEQYRITFKPEDRPQILVRAQANSKKCSGLPGEAPCAAVTETSPLISYAAALPKPVLLSVELNGQKRDIHFDATPLNLPIFYDIPQTAGRPLELFIGMLREAMVYPSKEND